MPRKIRVLIVDDAVVVRRLVTDVLAADPGLEVAGIAANGKIALAKIPQLNPDVITLDVEMPDMDGLTTVREIRKVYRKLPVIMFSTLTERGASATLEAISAGASDYVTKPANVGSVNEAMSRIRGQLIPKIYALCGATQPPAPAPPATPAPAAKGPAIVKPTRPFAAVRPKIDVVVIGVSTGGPNALGVVLPLLPKDLPVPVLIVQHMPPVFTRLLAERLATRCPLPVVEASAGMVVQPGQVYVAPGDFHMVVGRDGDGGRDGGATKIRLNQAPPENSCRPSVDVLFRAAAEVYGAATLAVELTGMGYDGVRGCRSIYDAGGEVIAQDEATSVVWGMPGGVVRAGLADKVLPIDQVAAEIARRVQRGRDPRARMTSAA